MMMQKYSSYFLCFLIAVMITALYANNFSFIERLEWKIQDVLLSLKSEDSQHGDIILVDIDDKAIKEYGEWPWPNEQVGDLVAAIGNGHPKTVLLDMFIDPDISMDTTGGTEVLAGQMSWMGNVVASFDYAPSEYMTNRISMPNNLFSFSLDIDNDLGIMEDDQSQLARNVFLPPAIVCQYAAGLGFKSNYYDPDRKIRWEPMALHYDGYYYPSAGLIAAAHYLDIEPTKIKIMPAQYVKVGPKEIPINQEGNYLISYTQAEGSFKTVSARDVLLEKYPLDKFKNKMVIVSLTATDRQEYLKSPEVDNIRSNRKTANVVENIIHGSFLERFETRAGGSILVLLCAGLAFAFVLPRMTTLQRAIVLGSAQVAVLMATYYLLDSMNILFKPFYLSLELLILFLAGPLMDSDYFGNVLSSKFKFFGKLEESDHKKKQSTDEKNAKTRTIENVPEEATEAINMKSGSNDPINMSEVKESQGETKALDSQSVSEENGEKTSAAPIDQGFSQEYQPPILNNSDESTDSEESADIEEESLEKLTDQSDGIIFNDSGEVIHTKTDLKNLGRYKVEGILGKGAMGTVYKGIDPAIDRNVALKTIRLDFVNDPAELEELKVRLSREAKAAGMLSHPNIVTIYDVGAEGNLQYIAMEFLEGQTLEDMIRRKVKFNYRIIAQIITQICTALDYAHNQGIVHRDIKPANIMVLDDYRIKVMDFGIARVDSSSMTRTGIAMGTPNYISPEQLQGKPVDRRCDVFSLGVVMYEMLLHRRPFKGENLTSLIYNIVNADPDLPSKVDPSVPSLFDRVIERALRKDPTARFQHASEISGALSDFVQSFVSK